MYCGRLADQIITNGTVPRLNCSSCGVAPMGCKSQKPASPNCIPLLEEWVSRVSSPPPRFTYTALSPALNAAVRQLYFVLHGHRFDNPALTQCCLTARLLSTRTWRSWFLNLADTAGGPEMAPTVQSITAKLASGTQEKSNTSSTSAPAHRNLHGAALFRPRRRRRHRWCRRRLTARGISDSGAEPLPARKGGTACRQACGCLANKLT